MFGGLAFLIKGTMTVSASGKAVARPGRSARRPLVLERDVRRFEMRGRAMDGWLHAPAQAVATDADLCSMVAHGTTYVRSLPAKQRR